jgi:hypothetical protein
MLLVEFDCKQETMATRVCERLKCNNHQFTAIGTYRFYCIIHCVNKTVRKKKTAVSGGEEIKMKAQAAR